MYTADNGGQNGDRESRFHERIQLLKEEGYRGFVVAATQATWKGVEVSVEESAGGKRLEASADTMEEAYKKVVDLIDHTLDGP